MKKLLICVLLVSSLHSEVYSVEEIRVAKCIVAFNKIRTKHFRVTTLDGALCNKYHAVLHTDGTYYLEPIYDRLNANCNLTKVDVWENAQKYHEAEKYCKYSASGFSSSHNFQTMRQREYDSVNRSIVERKKKAIENRRKERKKKLLEMVKDGEI